MRVLYLDQSGSLGGGELSLLSCIPSLPGSPRVLLFSHGAFEEALLEAKIPVDVVEPYAALGEVGKGASVLHAVGAIPALLVLVFRVAQRARDVDLLYANSQKAFVVAALAAFLTRRPLLWHLHDVLTSEHFSWPVRRLAITLGRFFATAIIANSEATAAPLRATAGFRTPIHVIHNGIDPCAFDAVGADDVIRIRNDLSGGLKRPLIGVFGRLAPWKGQHIFLEALAGLPEALGVIVGGPLFGEEAYEAALRAQARALKIEGRIHFLGFRTDIPRLMKAMDIIVHTSTAPEPFGRVIVEGMLAGRPVIASDAGGVREIIEEGVSGLRVPPGDPAALAGACAALLRDPARAAELGQTGDRRARTLFSPALINEKIAALMIDIRA